MQSYESVTPSILWLAVDYLLAAATTWCLLALPLYLAGPEGQQWRVRAAAWLLLQTLAWRAGCLSPWGLLTGVYEAAGETLAASGAAPLPLAAVLPGCLAQVTFPDDWQSLRACCTQQTPSGGEQQACVGLLVDGMQASTGRSCTAHAPACQSGAPSPLAPSPPPLAGPHQHRAGFLRVACASLLDAGFLVATVGVGALPSLAFRCGGGGDDLPFGQGGGGGVDDGYTIAPGRIRGLGLLHDTRGCAQCQQLGTLAAEAAGGTAV
jgi:hypothetical protein